MHEMEKSKKYEILNNVAFVGMYIHAYDQHNGLEGS